MGNVTNEEMKGIIPDKLIGHRVIVDLKKYGQRAVAASELGFDMDICEINDFYFTKGKERVEKSMKQLNLFK